jgi:hypothetical protein
MNNIISDPKGKATCIDIKDFYLGNPLPNKEYIRFHRSIIPDTFWQHYKLDELVDEAGNLYAEVNKGMYGLPHKLAKLPVSDFRLLPRLAKAAGYIEAGRIPGLFKHKTNSIKFALVVDDFLVKSCCQADLDHLQATVREHYNTITVDEKASRFCGITLDWDYTPQVTGKSPIPCQATLKMMPSSDSPMPNQSSTSLPPANGLPLNMEPRSNMLHLMTTPSH